MFVCKYLGIDHLVVLYHSFPHAKVDPEALIGPRTFGANQWPTNATRSSYEVACWWEVLFGCLTELNVETFECSEPLYFIWLGEFEWKNKNWQHSSDSRGFCCPHRQSDWSVRRSIFVFWIHTDSDRRLLEVSCGWNQPRWRKRWYLVSQLL